MKKVRVYSLLVFFSLMLQFVQAQVTPNINSGNPAVPFPQFLDYGPNRKSLASQNAPGVTHAEMEQRTREAWRLVCNNTKPYPNTVVSGVQYLMPSAPNHCTCVEGDGYYLLGAAIMGDKTYFDGYYMWTHDRGFNGVKRFIDGVNNPYPGYSRGLSYSGGFGAGTGVLGGGISGNSAADGDVDVALALLIAYKQWGEKSGIILSHGGWAGKEINYKEEALNYIRAMVDTSIFPPALPERNHVTGIIGLDGYMKRGDSWGELTPWALTGYLGMRPQTSSSGAQYIDYNAPAWFKQFGDFLKNENERTFLVNQYKRAEASSDWLMGLHYSKDPKNISYMGKVDYVSPTDFKFSNYIPDGEDFRGPWRTAMNYVWHGNPTYTWNPTTHQVEESKPNTYQYDMAVRYAKFLKNNQGAPWNNPCRNIGDLKSKPLTFKGTYTLLNGYFPDGSINGGAFPLNWIHGTGAASAIAAQDFELMGEMFRHCVIAWDAATGTNLDSRPIYFHEWFRLCGMLTLAGNFLAPDQMIARPNIKVYHKMDKTFAFTGDQLTYTVSYRNYGSVDGAGTIVKLGIPKGFEFVSSNKGTLSGDSVVWNVGAAKGFKSGALAVTMDSMKVIVKVGPTASGRYCTNARVSCTNGLGWKSDEYPNNITAVMERNCVDVVKRALRIEKTASRKLVNPSTNADVVYKIKFENSSDAGWINGGRPGVRLAFSRGNDSDLPNPSAGAANVLKYRLFHDAAEPYIDYGNYRVSYFMNDPSIKCLQGDAGCTTGWSLQNTIAEGVDPTKVKVTHETIVPGTDAFGSWNQRIVLQFSPQLATITQHLQQYAGSPAMVHEGGRAALRGVWRFFTSNYSNVNWTDDWSYSATMKDGDDGIYYPIGDDYTDPNNLGLPINSWHKSACQTTTNIMKNVLVEEWDGYTWRRVLGNGPLPGRDITNVVVKDTLPAGASIKNFIRQNPLGVAATTATITGGRTVITWTIPKMQINQKDSIVYTATIVGSCPGADKPLINKAWISGNAESAISEADTITVTCNPVTICPTTTTLTKSSDKTNYVVGETVKYTLNYTQTQGSIANPNLNNATDWTITGTGAASVSVAAGKITLAGGNSTSARAVALHDYSIGTNTLGNGIEGTIQIAASENDFAIVVRNDVYIRLLSSGGSNPTLIDIYSGTTKLNATSFSIPFFSTSFDFRIKLNGGTLSMWLVATGTEISGAASIIQTGIPIKQGSAGVSHGVLGSNPYATHTVSSWRSHMDVAFDVEITDPVPSGITGATTISTPGALTAGVVKWTLATGKANPIAYGTTRTLTWEGTFSTCQKVTNVAYVNTKGITGNQLGVCHEINCGNSPICVPPPTPTLANISLCQGAASPAVPTPVTSGNTYIWYTAATGTASVSVPDFTTATAPIVRTYYLAERTPLNGGCESGRKTFTFTVNPTPTAPTAPTIAPLCASRTTTLNKTGTATGSFYWYASTTGGTANANPFTSPVLTTNATYYLIDSTASGCKSTRTPVLVTVNQNPTSPTSPTVAPICAGNTTSLNKTGTATGTFYWYTSATGGTANANPFATPVLSGSATYYLIDSTASGCKSARTPVLVTVNQNPTAPSTPTVTPICTGNTASLNKTGTATGTYYWYTSATGGVPNPNPLTTPALSGNATYYLIDSTASGCKSGRTPVLVAVNPKPTAQFNFTPATGITTATDVTFNNTSTGATSYAWKIDGIQESTNPTTINKTFAVNKNYVVRLVATSANGCKDSTEQAVSVGVVPCTPPVTPNISDVNLCQGDAAPTVPTPSTANNTYVWYATTSGTVAVTPDFGTNNTTPRTYFVAERTPLNGGCESTIRDEVKVAINALPVPTVTTPFSQCGGTVDLATLTTTPNVLFYSDTLASALTNTFASTSGTYYVQTTSAQNCKSKFASGKLDVTIKAAPVADVNPKTAPYCGTGGSTLTATNAGTGATYEWFLGTSSMGTPTTNNTLNNALAGSYTVKTTLDGCSTTSTVPAVVSVVTAIEPKINIKANSLDTCLGSAMKVDIFSQDNGTVQWFEDGVAQGTGNQHAFNLTKTTKVKVVLTSSESCANPKTAADSVTVNAKTPTIPSVSITPDAQDACEGTTVNFSASPTDGLAYEWYVGTVRQIGSTNIFSSNTLRNNDIVRVVYASPAVCASPKTKDTSVTMTIKSKLAPSLRLKPTATQVCAGENVTFEIGTQANQGGSPTYSWLVNNTPFTAPATATSIVVPISAITNVYAVLASSETCVSSSTANSDTLKVSINTGVTPLVEITPIELKLCGTSTGNFSISKIEGEGATPGYQWLLNGNPIANAVSSSLTINTLVDGDNISLALSSSSTCKLKAGDTSNVASITIKAKPVATILAPVTVGQTYNTSQASANLTAAAIPANGYTGTWSIAGQGSLSNTQGASATLGGLVDPQVTEVTWTVSESTGTCPPSSEKIYVNKVDGPFANAGPDQEKCESETIELKGQGSAIGAWQSLTMGASLTGTGSDVTVNQKVIGTNQFRYCVTDNSVTPTQTICDTVDVNVKPTITPTISILRTLTSVDNCVGDLAEFTATASTGTIAWSNGSTGTIGTYTDWENNDQVTATITNNDVCASPKSVTSNTIILNGTAKQTINLDATINNYKNGSFCFGEAVNLVAVTVSNLVKYQWLATDQSVLSSDASYSFSASQSTTIILTTTAPAGCYTNAGESKTRTVSIEVEAPLTGLSLSYRDSLFPDRICQGNKGIFTVAGNAPQYNWYVKGSLDPTLSGSSAIIANLQNNDSVRVEAVSLAGCPVNAKAAVAVVVDQKPRIGLTTSGIVFHCVGKDTTLQTIENEPTYTYAWRSGSTILSDNPILPVKTEATGTVTIQNGACEASFPFEARATAIVVGINASPAENFEPGETLDLSASVSGNNYNRTITYQWSPAAILSTPNAANTKANPIETGFVKVIATSPEGCAARDSIELRKRNKLFIPNALTPESGDQNAAWNITGTENYPELDIKVFNRWGVLVHGQTGYTTPWDGNLNGKPLPAGTYYFVIKHRTLDKPLVGDLTIVR